MSNAPEAPATPAGVQARVGGWSEADPFDPDVQQAARFAVQAFSVQHQVRLLYQDVVLARQQVVAGIRHELQIQVSQDGALRNAQVTVWRQPGGRYSLTAWVWRD